MNASRRATDLKTALWVEYLTVGWMAAEFASSLVLALLSGSLLLLAFGIDSLIELASAGVVLWRLRAEAPGPVRDSQSWSAERRAALVTGLLLFALAIYIVVSSAYALVVGHRVDTDQSIWGVVIGAVAVVGMPVLAYIKRRLAAPARLDSKSLRADAAESLSCAYLSVVLVLGLVLSRSLGWWWLDGAAALALVPFIIVEGREAVAGPEGE